MGNLLNKTNNFINEEEEFNYLLFKKSNFIYKIK